MSKDYRCACGAKSFSECLEDCIFEIPFDDGDDSTIPEIDLDLESDDSEWIENEYLRIHGNANH
jgi:hypothetical protein